MTQVNYPAADFSFDRSWISDPALQVVAALQNAGFDGYLVGGCVRDLLLQRRPKDFDITTDASPEEVKKLFSRARIIGRRFKIVHVRFGREVIEVATYRAKPDKKSQRGNGRADGRQAISDSGRVLDDNVFGTIEQDAARRDFTINALYYDPNREMVVDFMGGVKDARKNTLRMIGEPRERFIEDPVRMLRALRFRAKLGLALEKSLPAAIDECGELLDGVPAARMFDETMKLFHHGHARKSWEELCAHDLIARLFPLTAKTTDDRAMRKLIEIALRNTDVRVRADKPVIAAFLFAVLLWRAFAHELARQMRIGMNYTDAVWEAGDAVFARQSPRVSVPRRVSETAIEIWEMQYWLEQRKPRAVGQLLAGRRFRAAYDFLMMRNQIGEVDDELARWWTEIQECDRKQQQRWAENLRASQSTVPNAGHAAHVAHRKNPVREASV